MSVKKTKKAVRKLSQEQLEKKRQADRDRYWRLRNDPEHVERERQRLKKCQRSRRAGMTEQQKEKDRESARRWRQNNLEESDRRLREWRKKSREDCMAVFNEWRNQGCLECSESEPKCIQAHHVDPSKKVATISILCNMGHKPEVVTEELKKCVPLCANCHIKKHLEIRKAEACTE